MKIAVTATGATPEATLDPRFGRCPYFMIVETDDFSFEALPNPNVMADSGAGIQTAQLVAEKGAKFVLTGNCGPNAFQTLSAAGMGVIVGCSGSVREVAENFKSGRYSTAEQPNVASHFGGATPASNASDYQNLPADAQSPADFTPSAGLGRSWDAGGRGFGGGEEGRGMGMGRGMGRGGGRGMGMGRGMGRGGGGGRGMGMGRGNTSAGLPAGPMPQAGQPTQPYSSDEIDSLKAQAKSLEEQLAALNRRMGQIAQDESGLRLVAVVDAASCTGCGLCAQVCPAGAIAVNAVANVNVGLCTACGQCVAVCPQEAISIKKKASQAPT
ncbi:MAG: 4Fe-4S binding protein [Pirellulales bacterium]|nr:4Fe-4S binding protein [Pirellulales bacterium]